MPPGSCPCSTCGPSTFYSILWALRTLVHLLELPASLPTMPEVVQRAPRLASALRSRPSGRQVVEEDRRRRPSENARILFPSATTSPLCYQQPVLFMSNSLIFQIRPLWRSTIDDLSTVALVRKRLHFSPTTIAP